MTNLTSTQKDLLHSYRAGMDHHYERQRDNLPQHDEIPWPGYLAPSDTLPAVSAGATSRRP